MPEKEITTARLVLRPLALSDCAGLQTAAGRREVADTVISVPHPFSAPMAEHYIRLRLGQTNRSRFQIVHTQARPISSRCCVMMT
ncbi:hypothetical protein [Candidatus Thiodictyon syntrophicum]|uniref:N-acetyltransferase domain-containing protein n=1 Tax=Candidatus Thiodictyon syntrophicum TaxID=1166950 RepID=A0A2K8UHI0_9GAMM|nr:hypothetical protein [Candidatus Thiodictyon syntrophicum]AUB85010.1 hypothetical protein THSYN_29150 [Candidatus Thiodictyon syntrophicum]